MIVTRFHGACCAAALATMLAAGQPVFAQSQLTPITPDVPTAVLGDIVVTAQRRAERVQDVPISMNVFSGETLKNSGVTRLEDIQRLAPAVQISRTGVYTQPAIRGITTLQAATVENNVAIYVDGFYQPSSRSLNFDLMNVAGVEVLKGPQGTLFGRNATGGAILVNTLQPSFKDTDARLSVGYGSFNDVRVQGYLSVPISDKVAVNATGSYRTSDGYIHNADGRNTAPLALYTTDLKLRLAPTDALNMTVGFRWNHVGDGRGLAITEEGHALAALVAPSFPIEKGDNKTSLNHPVINRANSYTGTAKIEYDAGPVTLTSLTMYEGETNYAHYDIDGSQAPVYDQFYHENFRTFSQEGNIRSNGSGRLQYVAGVYYFYAYNTQQANYSFIFPSTTYVHQITPYQYTHALAGYADVTWQPIDNIFLTGGIRYSHETKREILYSGTGALLTNSLLKFNKATPRAVLRYELAPNQNVYASFSQGFKSGFINSVAPYSNVQPEKINAYEIGYKRSSHGLTFNLAGYYYDYKNLQVSSIILVNGSQTSVTSNAATARIYGGEASLTVPISRDFVASANVAYTHARYRNYTNAVVSVPSAVTGLNSAICGASFCTQDWSGRQIARAPDWSGNVSANYTLHAGTGKVVLGGNLSFTSSYLPTKSDIGLSGTGYRYQQKGYVLLQLQAAWTLPGDKITLSVFGNNVTNQKYYIVKTGSAFGDYHVYGEPASIGVRADYRFR